MSRNKRKERSLSLEEQQAVITTLYDCSLDLKLKIPRSEEREDMDKMYRSVLITLAVEFVAKHEAYQGMIECIYNVLRDTLSATRRNWRVASKKEWVLNINDKSSGHLLNTHPPKDATAIYDTIEHSGVTWNDYNDDTITLDCNLKLFLSPGVLAATDIYDKHNFTTVDTFKGEKWDSGGFLYRSGALDVKKDDGLDFRGTWLCVLEEIKEYDDYWESKRRRLAQASTSDW